MVSWKERIVSFKQQRIVLEASDQQRILLFLFILGWENLNSIYPHETAKSLLKFRDWVIENGCEQVAIESTGIYWHPVHAVLEGRIDLIVANAYKIKQTPGRKQPGIGPPKEILLQH